jgi:hypothetical protein
MLELYYHLHDDESQKAMMELAGTSDNDKIQVATRYVQDVSAQTDRVIENSRKYII